MSPQTFIFIGRSGCGKGTQVELLKKVLAERDPARKIVSFETGAKFRELFESDSYTSRLSRKIYDEGELQPEFFAVRNWSNMMVEQLTGDEHVFFDGICRRLSETKMFVSAAEFYNWKPIVVYVNVSRKWSKDRLLARGRADDTDKGIDKRLDWFDRDTIPSIEYFKSDNRYTVLDINGEQTIEEVHRDIMAKLGW